MRFPAPIRGIQSLSSHTVQQSSNDVLSYLLLLLDCFALNWRLLLDVEIQRSVRRPAGRDRKLARHLPPSRSAEPSQVVARPRCVLPAHARHGTANAEPTPLISSLVLAPTTYNHPCPVPLAVRAAQRPRRRRARCEEHRVGRVRARPCLPPRATDGDHSAAPGCYASSDARMSPPH